MFNLEKGDSLVKQRCCASKICLQALLSNLYDLPNEIEAKSNVAVLEYLKYNKSIFFIQESKSIKQLKTVNSLLLPLS